LNFFDLKPLAAAGKIAGFKVVGEQIRQIFVSDELRRKKWRQ
jgi:hypothetical protein